MTQETHSVDLRAKDGISPVLAKVGQSAKQAGADISRSMDQAEQSTKRFSVSHAALGAAIGTTAGLMSEWARAAAEDEASTARLAQAVDNTGKSYDQFSQQIDKAIASGQQKAFSDDQ